MDKQICETCDVWQWSEENLQRGECRRFPPQIIVNKKGGAHPQQPLTSPHFWCGEWSPKPPEKVEEKE